MGAGSFEFVDRQGNTDRPITVWYHRPEHFSDTSPVVFVMHGVNRNGQEYRDAWTQHADQRGFLLVVPEFSEQHYPGARRYNLGFMRDGEGRLRDRSKWTFTSIERLFDRIAEANELKQKEYILYGHSAGAQFVHRMVMFVPEARIKLAIAANSGWYTMPQFDVAYPFGLQDTGVDEAQLQQVLGTRMVLLLGLQDTDPNHKHLNTSPEAMAQGPHRLARGKAFLAAGRRAARELDVDLRWRLQTVRGVGHSNSKMSVAAAKMIR